MPPGREILTAVSIYPHIIDGPYKEAGFDRRRECACIVRYTDVCLRKFSRKLSRMVHLLEARPSRAHLFKRADRLPLAVDRKVNITRFRRFSLAQGEAQYSEDDDIPANCSRYKVKLSKPLGLVLEEDRSGAIFVAEVLPGGNAERLGLISPRDQLIATSGFIRTTEQVYGQTVVQGRQSACWRKLYAQADDNSFFVAGGEQLIRLNCIGEKFDTVMAAIGSHLAGMEVELEFQKCSAEDFLQNF